MSSRLLCFTLLAACAPAFGATPINQVHPLAADGSVRIENVKGRITVRTWDQPQVRITGSLGEGVEKLDVSGSAENLSIVVRYPRNGGSWFGWGGNSSETTELVVTVPARAGIAVDSVSADVDVTGAGGATLSVDSVSGDVMVRGSRPGSSSFDTVSGDLDLELTSNSTSADTVSGDLRLRGRITGRVSMDSVSGSVDLEAGTLDRLEFSSVSGDAELRMALAPAGRINAETVSGNLTLRLPADTSARIAAESFSGSIRSPVGQVIKEKYGPGSRLESRLGTGSADIRLESFSGDIRLSTEARPAPAATEAVKVEAD